jgi:hypothetical protein
MSVMENPSSEPRDIVSLAYDQRRLITVADPAAVAIEPTSIDTLTEAVETAQRALQGPAGGYVVDSRLARRAALAAIPLAAAVGPGWAVTAGLAIYLRARRRATQEMRQVTGEVIDIPPLLPISYSEAKQLTFPQGHPRRRFVYAGHPLLPNRYMLIADFHERMFEHKFTELVRLLTSLGATRIEVEAVAGWRRDMAAHLDVAIPLVAEAEAKLAQSRERQLLYSGKLPRNRSKSLPAELTWYWREDTWQELVRQRLEHKLDKFQLQLSYRNDFGLSAEISTALNVAGFDIGGEFRRQVDTTWIVKAKFWDVTSLK